MRIVPVLANGFGAAVLGLDLADDAAVAGAFERVKQAFHDAHGLLVVRGQRHVTAEQLVRFG